MRRQADTTKGPPRPNRRQWQLQTASATAEILQLGIDCQQISVFCPAALARIATVAEADFAAAATLDEGKWSAWAQHGQAGPLPWELLSEVLDREAAGSAADWAAAPLAPRAATGELLVVHHRTSPVPRPVVDALEDLALVFGKALAAVRLNGRRGRRVERLEAILQIAGQWNRTREMEPLLTQMAEAATRLLGADRASIFLWDRPNHLLIGRPALGVEADELRIPDDTGIVGQVIEDGLPKRVDLADDHDQINRQVDRQLDYQTRTLLCVPLRGQSGELFGAFEAVNKLDGNFTDEDQTALLELAAHAAVALENTREREKLLESRRQITEQAAQGIRLIGQSPAIEALRSTIRRVADTDLAILILGKNGTGKEVVSRSIHYLSRRRDQPFIAVNCAALTETLLESELFGHEKGAFTDAHEARPGKFELASGGTLFLDEIGDLSPGGQSKLLRVLEEKVVVRVGGSQSIHTDTRVIAATNQDLAEMVREKKFREDLYFRINVVTLVLPSLRERTDDVLLLAEHFLNDFCRQAHRTTPTISASARRRLQNHNWPGNVRELRNLMERLAYLCPNDQIEADDLAFILAPAGEAPAEIPGDLPLSQATSDFQSVHIHRAIDHARGNMSEAAKLLGLHRSNLYRKMRQLGMKVVE